MNESNRLSQFTIFTATRYLQLHYKNKTSVVFVTDTTMTRNSTETGVLKENEPNEQPETKLASSCKKRRINANCTNGNNDSDPTPKNWEQLYKELAAERITKPEQLFYAYRQESQERETLMRDYNQDLENDNKKLKASLADHTEQKQTVQNLKNQLAEKDATLSHQAATIRAYQQMTGATLSNIQQVAGIHDAEPNDIGYDCTMENKNPGSHNARTKFRISVVGKIPLDTDPSEPQKPGEQQQQQTTKEPSEKSPTSTAMTTLLKYQPLENPEHLPDFLHEEIEFESTELPPLLQNVLRGIFPEE